VLIVPSGRRIVELKIPWYELRMKDIVSYLWKYRLRIGIGLVALTIVNATALISPLVIREAIDSLALGEDVNLLFLGSIIFALAVSAMIFRFFIRYFIIGTARKIERDIRTILYQHLTRLSTPYFNRTKTGDIMAHATNDMEAIMRACGFGVFTFADAVVLTTAGLTFMFMIDWQLTLYAILPLPFLCAAVIVFGRMIHTRFQQVQELFSNLMEDVREAISGIRVIKSFAQEEGLNDSYRKPNQEYIDSNMRLVRVWGVFDPTVTLLGGLGTAIVLWAGGSRVITGEISLGNFVAFTAYLGILIWPMTAIGYMVNVMQRGAASMGRVKKILAEVPEISSLEQPKPFPDTIRLSFKNLTFCYVDDTPALKNISFNLEPGQTLGIVGPPGAGKSTLANLVTRLYDPPPGTVYLGGVDIRELDIKQLRERIGVVPQDPFLFSMTLRKNICFGKPEASNQEIAEAARKAGILEELEVLPLGLETMVGERGVTLSGGQKQRMGIARALLMNPDLLILDDCLSAVDTEKEEEILSNLDSILEKKTAIVIAHRISVLQKADLILVLDANNYITERGDHKSLLKANGFYANLYRLQQAEQELREMGRSDG